MAMPLTSQKAVTQLLGDWSGGDSRALERLIPLVQPELHRFPQHYIEPGSAVIPSLPSHKVADPLLFNPAHTTRGGH